jgi:hypothetical protein
VVAVVVAAALLWSSCAYYGPWWVRATLVNESLCGRNGWSTSSSARALGNAATSRNAVNNCGGLPIVGSGQPVDVYFVVRKKLADGSFVNCSRVAYESSTTGVAFGNVPVTSDGPCAGPGTFVTVSTHGGWLFTTWFGHDHFPLVSSEFQLP